MTGTQEPTAVMDPLARIVAELDRRVKMLPDDVDALAGESDANVQGSGLHASQLDALKRMMGNLTRRQVDLLDKLRPLPPLPGFADIHNKLLWQIVGAQELWRLFRFIFAQRLDARLRPAIDMAELVAYDCYRRCMDRALSWGLIDDVRFRAPPLVYLDAQISPATNTRGQTFGAAALPVTQFTDMQLPIPLVFLPFDQVRCVWLLCGLHHEVGHDVDKDLGLSVEFKARLAGRQLSKSVDPVRKLAWQSWAGEVLADAFGVLLGGAGFAHAMAPLFLALAPKYSSRAASSDDHPNPWVRIPLLVAMLRKAGGPELLKAADLIEPSWSAATRPDWLAPYVADCDDVADVFLNEPLEALREKPGGISPGAAHPLRDLTPDLAGASDFARRLSTYLARSFGKPDQGPPATFPWRLVPAAAQLAIAQPEFPGPDPDLDALQQSTLDYLKTIEKPNKLGVGPDRSGYYDELVDRWLRFDPPPEDAR